MNRALLRVHKHSRSDLHKIDLERLYALEGFLKSLVEEPPKELTRQAEALLTPQLSESGFTPEFDLREVITAVPEFDDWSPPKGKGFEDKVHLLAQSVRDYLDNPQAELLKGEAPEEFRVLSAVLDELVRRVELNLHQ